MTYLSNLKFKESQSKSVYDEYPARLTATHQMPPDQMSQTIYEIAYESILKAKFQRLKEQWKEETLDMSSLTDMVTHRAYLQIIGMGDKAIPLLVDELRKEPNHWFVALNAISGDNPIAPEDAGNLERMTEAWLRWADQNEL